MKKTLLMGCLVLSAQVFAQTYNLFNDAFEDGSNNWVLNHSGGVIGNNEFVVNSSYNGNMSIEATPNQPAEIPFGPQGNYLHILPHFDCLGFAPVCNAHYQPTDESNTYAEMAYDISTIAATNVSVNFWYLCEGETGDAYGNVEYSIDGGMNWITVGPNLVDTADWGYISITDPAFDNQANLRVRFHWRNSGIGTGGDHALAIDQFQIDVETDHYTTMQHMSGLAFCPGTPFNISIQADGSYTAGNNFTVLLSDENGLFLPGQEIGDLASSTSGSAIVPVDFPQSLAAGTNYRIRVLSTNPSSTPITSEPFTINTSPTVGIVTDPDPAMMCPGESVELTAQGSFDVTDYEWSPATGLNATNTATVTATPASTITYTIEVTNADHCTSTRNIEVVVACAGIEENNAVEMKLYPNPASDAVHVTAAVNVSKAELLDQSGRILQTIEVNNTDFDLNISDLDQGVYFVRIDGNTASRFTKR